MIICPTELQQHKGQGARGSRWGFLHTFPSLFPVLPGKSDHPATAGQLPSSLPHWLMSFHMGLPSTILPSSCPCSSLLSLPLLTPSATLPIPRRALRSCDSYSAPVPPQQLPFTPCLLPHGTKQACTKFSLLYAHSLSAFKKNNMNFPLTK